MAIWCVSIPQSVFALKGRGFRRADKAHQIDGALAPEGNLGPPIPYRNPAMLAKKTSSKSGATGTNPSSGLASAIT